MNYHVLSRRSSNFRSLRRCYHVGKAASLNSAIERNLRKYGPSASRQPAYNKPRSEPWIGTSRSRAEEQPTERRNAFFDSRNSSFPKSRTKNESQALEELSNQFPRRGGHQPRETLRFGRSSSFSNRSREKVRVGQSSESQLPEREETHLQQFSKSQERPSLRARSQRSPHGRERSISISNGDFSLAPREWPSQGSERRSNDPHRRTWPGHRDRPPHSHQPPSNRELPEAKVSAHNQKRATSFSTGALSKYGTRTSTTRSRTASLSDKLPVSIPYTTPASEFLYGTSVVEAALRSGRTPRRKLYKLYIYNGENREVGERDNQLERLARKNGIDVVRIGNEGLRLMEKLSSGRPHNGYILEASPIPKLPVQSLGRQVIREGQSGYLVTIGHQSREEAAINGVSDFQLTNSSSGRMPFVLLLDGIVDPGNMGGILRTASFLGASAVAVSTRNSAPFTPVVLKASAGASENVTLFSISNPADFIIESQRAGWRLFAGVAPSNDKEAATTKSLSTDELGDPLTESPCILMLGSEGAGLRWNLRSKADVELYIRGCGQTYNVDSLNVSVAAGILCSAFLKSRSSARDLSPESATTEPEKIPFPEDLF